MAKTLSTNRESLNSVCVEPDRERYADEVTNAFEEVQGLFSRLENMKTRLIGTSNDEATEKPMRSHDGNIGRLVMKASMIREDVHRMHQLLNELDEYI